MVMPAALTGTAFTSVTPMPLSSLRAAPTPINKHFEEPCGNCRRQRAHSRTAASTQSTARGIPAHIRITVQLSPVEAYEAVLPNDRRAGAADGSGGLGSHAGMRTRLRATRLGHEASLNHVAGIH